MNDSTLETEKSDEATTDPKQSTPEAIYKKRIAPWKGLVIPLIVGGLAVGMWLLLSRRSRGEARLQPVAESETGTSFATLSPEQQAAIAVEVAQRRTLQGDVAAPGARMPRAGGHFDSPRLAHCRGA